MDKKVNKLASFPVNFIHAKRFAMKSNSKTSIIEVPRFRLIYVESGAACYNFDNSELQVKSGDLVLLTPGNRQITIHPGAPLIINNIAFLTDNREDFQQNRVIKNRLRPYNLLKELILEMVSGSGENNKEYLKLALKLFIEVNSNETADDRNSLKNQIENYINEHIHENLTVIQLSGQFHLSEGYFRRQFKNLFDESPKNFIKTKRLNQAIKLMKDGDLRMKEVAFSAGYGSEQDFCRQFKTLTGLTPKEYKKQFFN